MTQRITPHFLLSEFVPRGNVTLTGIQYFMLHNLCNNLEVIRDFLSKEFGRTISIKINNGVRMPSDNNRLRNAGFNPSETSDHLFGNMIKLRRPGNIKKFGLYYTYSVGAADIDPACGALEAWEAIKPYFTRKTGIVTLPGQHIKIGQMILEKRNSHWIHISNPPELIYSPEMVAAFLKRVHFLQSNNNGRSCETV